MAAKSTKVRVRCARAVNVVKLTEANFTINCDYCTSIDPRVNRFSAAIDSPNEICRRGTIAEWATSRVGDSSNEFKLVVARGTIIINLVS